MKTIFKYIPASLMVVVAAFLLPIIGTSPANAQTTQTAAACTRIATLATTSKESIATRTTAMDTAFATRLSNIANRPTTIDAKVGEKRASVATTFNDKITNLLATPGLTTAQQAAIKTFQTQVKQAEQNRENAVDAARTSYRSELTKLVAAHQQSLSTASESYASSVSSAFATAQTDCTNGNTPVATLQTSLKAARSTFQTAREDAKVGDSLKQLIDTRNTTIKDADTTFTTLVAQYGTALSTALHQQDAN